MWTSKPNYAPQPLLDAPYPEPEIRALIRSLHPEVVVGQDQVQGPWIKGVLVAMLAAVMKITTFSPPTCQWIENTNVLIWWDTVLILVWPHFWTQCCTFNRIQIFAWYFVSKVVLTYFEKKLFLRSRKTFVNLKLEDENLILDQLNNLFKQWNFSSKILF